MPATAAALAMPPAPQPVRPIVGRPHDLGELGEIDVGPTTPALLVRGEMAANPDAPLVWRAQAGDGDAFGELYGRHEDRVRHYLASRLRGRPADVDDLVAGTFLTAMERLSAFQLERPGEFGNWLLGIARYKLLSWYQRSGREVSIDEFWPATAARAGVESPEDLALDRLEVADTLAAVEPEARRALVLKYAVGLPCAEIALALGTTKRMVTALTEQARLELRGDVRSCACGCGVAIRPERWVRDRYATNACRRRMAARPLCACGCGAKLPAIRAHNRRYATKSCRNRAAWQRRREAQRRYLAGPVAADPAVERVLAIVQAAGGEGMTRTELSRRARLLAARLDRAIDLLASRWSISVVLEPSNGRLVMRYRALAEATARRAA